MITKAQAMDTSIKEFWHIDSVKADGSPVRVRRNGACKTWKRRPDKWVVPVKHGLSTYFIISSNVGHNNTNANRWCVPALWAAERELFKGVEP